MANPLDEFKKLPTWGKVAAVGGGAFAVYIVVRAHSAAASTASTAADTSNIDPQTGYVTGSAEDTAALAALQGGGSFPVEASSGGVTTAVGTTSGYGTNAAWSQAAEAGLAEVGFDPVTVSTALGAYLAGQTLTADQAAIVFAATAEFGAPPVSPPPVTLSSSTGTAVTGNDTGTVTSGTGTTGTTTAGGATTPKTQPPTLSGGHVVSTTATGGVVAWKGTGATSWQVTLSGPGSENGRVNTVGIAQATYSGLESGHTYTVTIHPVVAGKVNTSVTGKIDFVTKK